MVATFLPPGADGVCVVAGHTVGDRKTEIGSNFGGLFLAVDRACEDGHTQGGKLFLQCFVAGQLPAAEGSPMASVEQDDRVWGRDILGQGHGGTVLDGE